MHNNKNIELSKNTTHWLTFRGPDNVNVRVRVYVSETGNHVVVDTDVHNANGAILSTRYDRNEYDDFHTISNEDWVRWKSNQDLTVAATTTLYKSHRG